MTILLKTNKEDLDKLSLLGFNCTFYIEDNSYFVKAEKENFTLAYFGKITEEQFFKVFNNSSKCSLDEDKLTDKLEAQKLSRYGFMKNALYIAKAKKAISVLLN